MEAAGLAHSTYYYHQTRLDRPDKHRKLKEAIKTIFDTVKQRYDYRRVLLELRRQHWQTNHKLAYKLMDQMGLKYNVRLHKKCNSYKRQISCIAENVLDRNFTPDRSNRVWVSDVTEFRVTGTKVHLSPIMQLHDRSTLSYELSRSPSRNFKLVKERDHLAPAP